MNGIIVKLLHCFIATSPSPSPNRRGNNLTIEQCNPEKIASQFNGAGNRKPSLAGFTLIELLVVIALIGILSGGILIALNIGGNIDKAKLTQAKKFAAQLENGLAVNQIGKWSFEEIGTDKAKDTSGYGNNGDLAGTGADCSVGGAACPTWKTATECNLGFGGCLSFDGSDYIKATSKFGDIDFKYQPFTITAWVKPNALIAQNTVVYLGTGVLNPESKFTFRIFVTNDASLPIRMPWWRADNNPPGRVEVHPTNGKLIPIGSWSFIAVTFNGTPPTYPPAVDPSPNIQVYLDGKKLPIITTGSSWDSDSTANIIIGGQGSSGGTVGSFFNGLIDEVQIYNQPLTLSQIQKLYAQGWLRKKLSLRF